MQYDELFALVSPLIGEGRGVLWMRRMVLGPTPEFCLQSSEFPDLPASLVALLLTLRQRWPERKQA
jgi:hypothetical protein